MRARSQRRGQDDDAAGDRRPAATLRRRRARLRDRRRPAVGARVGPDAQRVARVPAPARRGGAVARPADRPRRRPLGLALRGVGRAAREQRAAELLAAAGLEDRGDALPGRLSGGERQRVAVCAAVAHRPGLLLADEPTAELDDAAAEAIAQLIERLADRDGATVITVSHDPELARRAGRTVRIRDGRVVQDGDSLVVAPGGWVRLGDERLRAAGIGRRLQADPVQAGLLLTGAATATVSGPRRRATPAARSPVRPVTVTVDSVTTRARRPGGASGTHPSLRPRPDDGGHRPLGGRQDDAAGAAGRHVRARCRRDPAGPGASRRRRRAAGRDAPRPDRLPAAGTGAGRLSQRCGEHRPGADGPRVPAAAAPCAPRGVRCIGSDSPSAPTSVWNGCQPARRSELRSPARSPAPTAC